MCKAQRRKKLGTQGIARRPPPAAKGTEGGRRRGLSESIPRLPKTSEALIRTLGFILSGMEVTGGVIICSFP